MKRKNLNLDVLDAENKIKIPEMNLKLEEYPNTIAELERRLLDFNNQFNNQELYLESIVWSIDKMIAFSPEFKNEQQRKLARIEELDKSETYQKAKVNFDICKQNRDEILIELNRIKNQFSVAKIQARLRIAEMTMTVEGWK